MNSKEKVYYILQHILEGLLSIPKTLYFNFSVLPLRDAIKLPVIVSHRIALSGVNKKTVIINGKKKFASIRIGFGASRFSIECSRRGMIRIENGTLTIGENTGLSEGVIIDAKNANIVLGRHFRCNYATIIAAENDDVIFGDEVVLGWRINIRNYDGHSIVENGEIKPNHQKIIVGNHVWICSHSDLLKGARICDDSVIGYGSLVTGQFLSANVLIAGRPAKILKQSIDWVE